MFIYLGIQHSTFPCFVSLCLYKKQALQLLHVIQRVEVFRETQNAQWILMHRVQIPLVVPLLLWFLQQEMTWIFCEPSWKCWEEELLLHTFLPSSSSPSLLWPLTPLPLPFPLYFPFFFQMAEPHILYFNFDKKWDCYLKLLSGYCGGKYIYSVNLTGLDFLFFYFEPSFMKWISSKENIPAFCLIQFDNHYVLTGKFSLFTLIVITVAFGFFSIMLFYTFYLLQSSCFFS